MKKSGQPIKLSFHKENLAVTRGGGKLENGVQQTAAHFVTRLYSGELSAAEEQELQQWRKSNDKHEEAFQAMLSLWELSNHLYQPVAQSRTVQRRLRSWGTAAAAGVLLSAGMLYFANQVHLNSIANSEQHISQTNQFNNTNNDTSQPLHQSATVEPVIVKQEHRYLHTGVGEVDTVALSDGSTVTLNTATTLQVAFNDNERYVVLVEGEAFFDVESDINRVFVIDTGEQTIRVLGTKFNVRKENSAVRVAVVEGKVAVSRVSSIPSADNNASGHIMELDTKDYLLEAGAIGSFSATADVVAGSNFAQVSEAQSWRRGIFRFDDSSLEAVVKEFNRYRTHKIKIIDESAAELRISGVFHFNDGDGLLEALTASLPIELEVVGDEVLIRKLPKLLN